MKVSIGKAAEAMGVCQHTLRRWEDAGKIESFRTNNGHRRYDLAKLQGLVSAKPPTSKLTLAYARVSSHDQKADLERQKQMLEMYCAQKGWIFKIISDLGSGMNYRKRGLKTLLEQIMDGKVKRLVLTHKDRLLRFGAELVFNICEAKGVEVVIINQGDQPPFEEELAQDVLEIITVFSARLYGSRSRKNKKLMDTLQTTLEQNHA